MKFIVTVFALVQLLSELGAEDSKEARFIDENALNAFLELAQQAQPQKPVAPALQPEFPYLSQNERLTLQGERQTHYPVQPLNVEYILPPQQAPSAPSGPPAKPSRDNVNPVTGTYAPKGYQALNQAVAQALANWQALAQQPKPNVVASAQLKPQATIFIYQKPASSRPTQANNAAVALKPAALKPISLSNLLALTNKPYNQLKTLEAPNPNPYQPYAATNAPSYIIINPTTYPSFHYYSPTNFSLPSIATNGGGSVEPMDAAVEVPNLENIQPAESSPESPTLEIQPLPVPLPTIEESIFAQALLEQSGQPDNHQDLLELLKRDQLKRRLQEQVAAFFFRNYKLSKK